MTTYYCMKNEKCPTKTCDTTPVNAPTCCNTPMTIDKKNTTWFDMTNMKTAPNMNTAPKKDCCSSN